MEPLVNNKSASMAARISGRVREFPRPVRDIPDARDYREYVTGDGRRAFIAHSVLIELEALGRRHQPYETAALLFGRAFVDSLHSRCVMVTDIVLPEPGEVTGTELTVTISGEGAHRMISRARRRNPCSDPVGWAHTHPRFEAFFSGTDRTEQRAWKDATSVGLVVSGLPSPKQRFAVFVGPESAQADAVRRTSHAAKRPARFIGHPLEQDARWRPLERHDQDDQAPSAPSRLETGHIDRRHRPSTTAPVLAFLVLLALITVTLSTLALTKALTAGSEASSARQFTQASDQLAASVWWSGPARAEVRRLAMDGEPLAAVGLLLRDLFTTAIPSRARPTASHATTNVPNTKGVFTWPLPSH